VRAFASFLLVLKAAMVSELPTIAATATTAYDMAQPRRLGYKMTAASFADLLVLFAQYIS